MAGPIRADLLPREAGHVAAGRASGVEREGRRQIHQRAEAAPQVLDHLAKEQDALNRRTNLYAVRLELRAAEQPPLVLASLLVAERQEAWAKGFDVLDVLVEPGSITLAVAEGGDIELWRVGLLTEPADELTRLIPAEWSPYAAAYRRNRGNVKVALSRSKQGRLMVEVTELLSGQDKFPHAIFEQVEGQWRFQKVNKP